MLRALTSRGCKMVVVISAPQQQPQETRYLSALLDAGVERLHIRKPGASKAQVADVIDSIHKSYHRRLVVHGHQELLGDFDLAGVHGSGIPGAVSASVHELSELQEVNSYEYVFFSPVFKSISKVNYMPNFSLSEIASVIHAVRVPTLALGGVTLETARTARQAGFGGVAVLGAVWGAKDPVAAYREICASWSSL
jgi:thiamine-phosphate pyrophosphorylase